MRRRRGLATGCGAALALVVVLVTAAPASAHAVLLNSEPAPQATFPVPPTVVRLQFSEPVESQFGSVRVVDNAGHDVTSGSVVRRSGGRELDVTIRPRAGTTYVNWQVVSSDGHVERGEYPFFVGAPSKEAARPPALLATVAASVTWVYGAARFGWFAALFALVGLAVAWEWLWRPVAGDAAVSEDAKRTVERRFARSVACAWLLLVLSGAAVLVGQTATEAGRSLAWAARPSSLSAVLETTAGRYWLAALLVAAAAVVPVAGCALAPRLRNPSAAALLVVMAGVAAATALEGHARTVGHAAVGVPALTVHLLAVGVWAGGLGGLLLLGGAVWRRAEPPSRSRLAALLVLRFSRVALVAVVAVAGSGLVSSLLDLSSPSDLVDIPYGRMLLLKIVLLQAALVFGARHLWFGPGAADGLDSPVATTAGFRRSAGSELGVLGLAVVAASSLMVMVPGRSAALAAVNELDVSRRSGRYTVAVSLVPNQPGDDQLYVLFLDDGRLPVRAVTAPSALMSYPDGPARPVPLVRLSDGRFGGSVTIPRANRYGLIVDSGGGPGTAAFTLRVSGASGSQP